MLRMMRTCSKCGIEKELDKNNFRRHSGRRLGYRHECRECADKYHIAYARRWEKLPIIMLQSARNRAKRDSVPCTITSKDIVIPEYCPALGVRLVQGNRHDHAAAPTLDRVIPAAGYVPNNIRVISHRANLIKNNASLPELKQLIAYLESA